VNLKNTALLLGSLALCAQIALAHEGHNYGPDLPSGQSLPRVVATSELFELVGVLEGKRLTMFLDQTKDNAPIAKANVQLETGSYKGEAKEAEDATFVIELPAPLAPGDHPMTFTVAANGATDLLAGTLHLDAPAAAAKAASHAPPSARAITTWLGGGVLVLILVVLVAKLLRRLASRKGTTV
jgi:hypothetical protein